MSSDNSTVIVIDARTRDLNVHFASATQLAQDSTAIVLRMAIKVGQMVNIWDSLPKEFPILVMGEYWARSSAGFASLMGAEKQTTVYVVGGAGFGRDVWDEQSQAYTKRGDALRPFSRPIKSVLFPATTHLHAWDVHTNMNQATAAAAFAGLKLLAQRMACLVEGQSNMTQAYTFQPRYDASFNGFPEEHRSHDVFSKENMLRAAIGSLSRRRGEYGDPPSVETVEGRKALNVATLVSALRAGKGTDFINLSPEMVIVLGDIREVAERMFEQLLAEGWTFGFDLSVGNHFTRAVSPGGVETLGNALFPDPDVEEQFLRIANAMTEEEKIKMRATV